MVKKLMNLQDHENTIKGTDLLKFRDYVPRLACCCDHIQKGHGDVENLGLYRAEF
jgi:hypothetical protein